MALACEDSRMSFLEGELSNTSPCKAAGNNKATTTTLKSDSSSSVKKEDSKPPTNNQLDQDEDAVEEPVFVQSAVAASRKSWFEIVEEEQFSDDDAVGVVRSGMDSSGADSKMSVEEGGSNSNTSIRSNRQIEIDIIDSANVKKYEKLMRNEKIKSPFKRRLSADDDDEDANNAADNHNDGHAKFEVEAEYDPPPQKQHKKTKTHKDDHGRERFRLESSSSSSADGSSQSSRKPIEYEKDQSILERRQKQIDYGKNTLGYENYLQQVPRDQRNKDHPKTPPKHIKYSRRAWDGLVKVWRKQLHCFDPDAKPEADD